MNNGAVTPTAVRAPCIKVCEIDGSLGLCKGCFRTQIERDWWVAYSDEQRLEVLRSCDQRRDAVKIGNQELAACMGVVESRRKALSPLTAPAESASGQFPAFCETE